MIDRLVRQEVKATEGCKELMVPCRLKMDANENEWGFPADLLSLTAKDIEGLSFHRYPDSDSAKLREKLAGYTGVPAANLMVGNGSDELIHYVVKTFVGAGDRVVLPLPAFSMYSFFLSLAGGVVIPVNPDEDLYIDVDRVIAASVKEEAKVVFLCSPNNPVGSVIPLEDIKRVIENCPGIVVVDEAYYEFYGKTVIDWIDRYPNLVVIRTLSKAAGIAGLRVGYLAAGDDIMQYLCRVKIPFNVNAFSQYAAGKVLDNRGRIDTWLDTFKEVREDFIGKLNLIEGITVFPSQTNFVLIRMEKAQSVWDSLFEKGILTRKFPGEFLKDYIRVTVCPPGQNDIFIEELKKSLEEVCR
jgi:histidinol-phosphate aminotransferase